MKMICDTHQYDQILAESRDNIGRMDDNQIVMLQMAIALKFREAESKDDKLGMMILSLAGLGFVAAQRAIGEGSDG